MSETIEATTGPDGNVDAKFDGEALDLNGYTASPLHFPIAKLQLKRKKKPEKDGGQVYYFLHPSWSSRIEVYTRPEDIPGMEKLVDALLAADVKTF